MKFHSHVISNEQQKEDLPSWSEEVSFMISLKSCKLEF